MNAERRSRAGIGARLLEGVEARLALMRYVIVHVRARLLLTLVAVLVAAVLLLAGLASAHVLLVLVFWEQRVLVATLVTGVYLGVGVVVALLARSRLRNAPQPFATTLEELRRDAEELRTPEGNDE